MQKNCLHDDIVPQDLRDLVDSTPELATLPSTIVELLFLLKDSTASADVVRSVLEKDPAMTANVLKLANSAFYGTHRKISTVRDALVVLGNRCISTLAFATGMAPVMRRDLSSYGIGREQFWKHAQVSAVASSVAADQLGHSEIRCEAFTAGLVHDIGMIPLDTLLCARDEYLDSAVFAFDSRVLEQELLGYDHSLAGALMAHKWGFPDNLIEPIRCHHEPDQAASHKDIALAVFAGNIIARILSEQLTNKLEDAAYRQLKQIGLDICFIEELGRDLAGNINQTLALASRPVPPSTIRM